MMIDNTNIVAFDIDKIRIRGFEQLDFEFQNDKQWSLTNLSQINIFTGSNNSGKSRLMRLIATQNRIIDLKKTTQRSYLNHCFDALKNNENLIEQIEKNNYPISEMESILFSLEGTLETHEMSNPLVTGLLDSIGMWGGFFRSHFPQTLEPELLNLCQVPPELDDRFEKSINNHNEAELIYIPTLRGLRPIDLKEDHYSTRTEKDYFDNLEELPLLNIFTGHSFYEEIRNKLLNNFDSRMQVIKYEEYLSRHFFNNRRVSLIPSSSNDVVLIKIGSEQEHPIYKLGDGIQSIIILTFKLFTASEPSIFLIEEPEQHLHAGMQMALIEAFSLNPQHLIFLTSHSNHLLDIAQESENISVFNVSKDKNNISQVKYLSDYSSALKDLGVRASSVMLSNCSIWVEGVTDKLYIRSLIHKYVEYLESNNEEDDDNAAIDAFRSMQENLHYVFIEYQGSNVMHWDFGEEWLEGEKTSLAKALSNNVCLIADKDIETKDGRDTYLKEALGKEKFHLLPYKEIENCIPVSAIKAAAQSIFESCRKQKNPPTHLDLAQFEENKYRKMPVGKYLETLIRHPAKANITPKMKKGKTDAQIKTIDPGPLKYFEGGSGTISQKVKFCENAIKHIKNTGANNIDWNNETRELCTFVLNHILASNNKPLIKLASTLQKERPETTIA
ncbi:AAA family ATPase [Vibrio atlanticus]|uniref:AAA family ATPase n=1 Tax=Vibrio atlanticus TaxID=693153 RepID=UPI00354F3378